MPKPHHFEVKTTWTGNTGQGTSDYRAYKRDHEISGERKSAPILGSSDPVFRGDAARYNPEELLVGSLSTCHMLWMLHLCAEAGITIVEYTDQASGVMEEDADGSGRFTEVTLHPSMTITEAAKIQETQALHKRAHELCFIANSVNFPVHCAPVVVARG
ncbi:MAG TPA: OsmC family protein [Bryobacteraceae bacterium]|nr:OsmC family protein [Bryobacteraceae bacterium]